MSRYILSFSRTRSPRSEIPAGPGPETAVAGRSEDSGRGPLGGLRSRAARRGGSARSERLILVSRAGPAATPDAPAFRDVPVTGDPSPPPPVAPWIRRGCRVHVAGTT
jgi:hypothetical protein